MIFVGPVALAVAHKLLSEWIDEESDVVEVLASRET
jgi:hypothetical protein